MKKKKWWWIVLVILVGIQFIRPAKNSGVVDGDLSIAKTITVPDDVQAILKKSCYDCHSNHTEYPWYDNIQPVGWWMARHISQAKKRVNFDEWKNYPADKAQRKLHGIAEEVEGGDMPLTSYTLIHHDAKLSAEQKQKVIDWAKSVKVN